MWRKGNPCTLSVEMKIGAATVENSMEVPQTKNRTATLLLLLSHFSRVRLCATP